MVYDSRSTVHGQRPDKVCTTKPKCVPGTDLNCGTHQSRATAGIQRMCTMCTMCTGFSGFLLENILKHVIDFKRKLIEKGGTHGTHLWNYYISSLFLVELLVHTWYTSGTHPLLVVHSTKLVRFYP
jgi:hypothetical protein